MSLKPFWFVSLLILNLKNIIFQTKITLKWLNQQLERDCGWLNLNSNNVLYNSGQQRYRHHKEQSCWNLSAWIECLMHQLKWRKGFDWWLTDLTVRSVKQGWSCEKVFVHTSLSFSLSPLLQAFDPNWQMHTGGSAIVCPLTVLHLSLHWFFTRSAVVYLLKAIGSKHRPMLAIKWGDILNVKISTARPLWSQI